MAKRFIAVSILLQSFFTPNNLAESFFMDHKYRESSLKYKGCRYYRRPSKDDLIIVFLQRSFWPEKKIKQGPALTPPVGNVVLYFSPRRRLTSKKRLHNNTQKKELKKTLKVPSSVGTDP